MTNEKIIKVDLDEALKLAEAAQAMLTALKAAKQQLKPIMTKADHVVFLQVDAAITQAEAAGITTGEDNDRA